MGARPPASRLGLAFACSLLLHLALLTLANVPKRASPTVAAPLSVLLIPLRPPVAAVEEQAKLSEEQKAASASMAPVPRYRAAPPQPKPVPAPPAELRTPRASAWPVSAPRFMPAAGPVGAPGRLTRHPSLAAPLEARYPPRAFLAHEKATVVFALVIDEAGRVEEARPLTEAAQEFVETAAVALQRARFRPGEIGGRPVRTRAYFAVGFELE